MKVQDNGTPTLSNQATVTVNLLNVNEPPVIANQAFSINENSANGTTVGSIVASDPDAGQTLTYSILSGNTSGTFTINASSGVLSVADSTALDFEVTPFFALIIKVQDNGTGTLNSQAKITINLLDVNEPPVLTNQSYTVTQFAPNGTVVGTVGAYDPDAGQQLAFSVMAGNTGNAFAVNPVSGIVTVANSSALNLTTNPVFNLDVRATDNGAGSLYDDAIITSTLIIGTNQPPVISNQLFSINENSPNGTSVGTVIASDPDPGQLLSYSIISGNTGSAFEINASTGLLSVTNSTALNFESTPSFALVVNVMDNGIGALSSQAIITISLLNVNELPQINAQAFSINENTVNGTNFGTVVASDPDAGQTLTYSILSGNMSGAFGINASSGVLSVVNPTALNFEVTPSFSLVVKVQDNGTPILSNQAIITVILLDVNEPPVIYNQTFTINANAANGTFVGTVIATEPDAGQTLTYSILSGNTSNAFAINSSTGVLTVVTSSALNFQTTPAFALVVKVQDNGTGSLSSQAIVIVNLLNTGGCTATGFIAYQRWNNIGSSSAVIALTSNVNYPNNPSSTSLITSMEAPTNVANRFGTRIAGYICAPATGNYRFWISSDDNGELWLSTNDQPTNKQKIAYHTGYTGFRQWNKYSTQKSVLISLVQGQTYYIEALMKEATGSDNLSVGWLKPGQTGSVPSQVIPGSVLSPIAATVTTTAPIVIIPAMKDDSINVNLKEQDSTDVSGGMFDNQTLCSVNIYPNPVTGGILNVQLAGKIQEGFELLIFDMSGKPLLNRQFEQQDKVSLDVTTFTPGMYVLIIRSANFSSSGKFIIN